MRAILDTNVLISAYVFPGGTPEAVYRLALEGQLEVGTTRTLLAELGRVLGQKFDWMPDQVEAAVAQVARIAAVVEPGETVRVVTADPADDRVLEAARAFGADVIVSGDRHLLDLGTWSGIEIISPAELIARRSA
ncbi:MAG: putative toxin-antitoxin system toxin component, PIN family [Chloroflexi bacterium]|jgi:putative PIN family toxin of toxin-antitoxin system|nr:putative toxin-antitoxin system toxin component, PIN family [Chloroflexota bacterium]